MEKIEDDVSPDIILSLNGFLSEKTVLQVTTLSRTSLHRKRVAGKFPEPEIISAGRKAYRAREVYDWLKNPRGWSSPNEL